MNLQFSNKRMGKYGPTWYLLCNGRQTEFKITYDVDFECYIYNVGHLNKGRYNGNIPDVTETLKEAKAVVLEAVLNCVPPEMMFDDEYLNNNHVTYDLEELVVRPPIIVHRHNDIDNNE